MWPVHDLPPLSICLHVCQTLSLELHQRHIGVNDLFTPFEDLFWLEVYHVGCSLSRDVQSLVSLLVDLVLVKSPSYFGREPQLELPLLVSVVVESAQGVE